MRGDGGVRLQDCGHTRKQRLISHRLVSSSLPQSIEKILPVRT